MSEKLPLHPWDFKKGGRKIFRDGDMRRRTQDKRWDLRNLLRMR
jgi:hypothetical protein